MVHFIYRLSWFSKSLNANCERIYPDYQSGDTAANDLIASDGGDVEGLELEVMKSDTSHSINYGEYIVVDSKVY